MHREMTRRSLLRRAVAAGSLAGIGGASPFLGWAIAPGPHRGGAQHDPGSRRAGLTPGADRVACLTA